MGIGLKVSCDCFGEFTMMVGERIKPPKYSLFPFMCIDCDAASALDIYADSQICEHCGSSAVGPYGRDPAVGALGPQVDFACGPTERFTVEQLTLTDGTYWCPTCQQHTACFTDAGLPWV